MFKAIKDEIKNGILKTFFHFIRFGGLLFIPLLYGFSYIYAFYDPFENVDQVKISIATNGSAKKHDELSNALGEQLSHHNEMKIGDMEMTMKMDHIYTDDSNMDDVKTDSYATISIGNLTTIDDDIVKLLQNYLANNGQINKARLAIDLLGKVAAHSNTNQNNKLFNVDLNYKKNYLLAFGIEGGASMFTSIQFINEQFLFAIQNPTYVSHLVTKINNSSSPPPTPVTKAQISALLKGIEEKSFSHINPIHVEAHMGEHAKYGYGLAPFFISVSMWIGGMVLTFAIHRKIYDKSVSAGKRYLAKWLIMLSGVITQATILMTALYFIGFKELGTTHVLSLYGGAIVSGAIFSTVIMAIRFTIPNREVGILLTICLLVLQMASGGGLFPIETQSEVYSIINKIVPMGRTVEILRELSFNTDWSSVMINLGYLMMWLFIVPFSVWANNKRTVRIYKEQNWELPREMDHRENVRQAKLENKRGKND